MSMRINLNMGAMIAHRNLQMHDAAMAQSIARLSSGLRINSAADDPAGLAISENFRTQISGMTQAMRNTQDAINMVKTAESALGEMTNQLRNIRDLALHAANDLRVNLGAFQRYTLESNLTSLAVAKENTEASESAIRDTDMAAEMVNFTRHQILAQAAQAMLIQANQSAKSILQMLR